jgi:ABC-type cobalamin/Fe3+-siderophores transport system ATPase subunit
LLRFFHEARPAFEVIANPNQNNNAEWLLGKPRECTFLSVADVEEVYCNRNGRDMTATFWLDAPPSDQDLGLEPSAIRFRWSRPRAQMTIELEVRGRPVTVTSVSNNGARVQVKQQPVEIELQRLQAVFQELSRAIYLGPFRNAVNIGGSTDYYDLHIGERFIETWDQFKTGNNREQNRAAIAVERELQEIFGLDKLEINAAPGNTTLQVIADDQPYQLQEQGAGLAQFVVVLAFVVTRRPSYILIDEPELNLHPALQLDFLTTLARYCERGVAFATHSIGLARAIGHDVFSVRRLADGSRELRSLEATQDYVQFLGELGLSGYTELGFTRVLLVEGTTEVPTLQRWLRLYGIEHEVLLLPLGGGSLINPSSGQALKEICRITSRVSVVIDSERRMAGEELSPDRQGFVNTCKDLGFDTHVLDRRAIENYFTEAAIKAVKGEKYRALGHFEELSALDPRWGKNENWRIASEMSRTDLEDTDLGAFLSKLRPPDTV